MMIAGFIGGFFGTARLDSCDDGGRQLPVVMDRRYNREVDDCVAMERARGRGCGDVPL